jgi:uncharacterized protein YidB (DUF937 family)
MGLLNQVIRTVVISALGAKLAKGRSPIVAALLTLLATRALAKREDDASAPSPDHAGGLGGLIDRFRQGGLEDIIKSWIGTGPNQAITPSQLHEALGPETMNDLSLQTGMPRDDLLSQLSRLLPEVIDKLTPKGQLPPEPDLVVGPDEPTPRR